MENAVDYSGVLISDLVQEHGKKLKMQYEYDFGDGWLPDIVLETISPLTERVGEFPRCLDGKYACPPEDIGGVYGFAEFLEAIANPAHPEHEDMLDWGKCDFEDFVARKATAKMQLAL